MNLAGYQLNASHADTNIMYFWICESLWFIKLVWAGRLIGPNIIKHLVKSFSTVQLTTAGKPLEKAITARSIIFLLAFRMAREGIIRTLKWVGSGKMLQGRICLPPTGYICKLQYLAQKKKCFSN